jgi:response regulator of citrate/malate metabolism
MSTAAVLERYGEQLQVSGTLLKPITNQTLQQALERYR